MRPVGTVRGRMLPLDRSDVDTDQIMPKQFLTRIERTGYGEVVFHDWRQDPEFVFNDSRFAGATVLVAGRNFGSGSSREHAAWGLQQYGLDAIVAPSFADIFSGNCRQVGLLTARVPEPICRQLIEMAQLDPASEITLDLAGRSLTAHPGAGGTGVCTGFDIDPIDKDLLLRGLDDIDLIRTHEDAIAAFELAQPSWLPTTLPSRIMEP